MKSLLGALLLADAKFCTFADAKFSTHSKECEAELCVTSGYIQGEYLSYVVDIAHHSA